jgi:hypothetical protein
LHFFAALCIVASPCLPASTTDDDVPAGGDVHSRPAGTMGIDSMPTEKLPAWLQLGGQIRGRFEDTSGTSLLNNSPDAYYLSRIRIDLGVKPFSGLRFFVQAQDARVGAYNSAPAPTTIYNPMDLRQGYAEVSYEGPVALRLRAGRQELAFGGERLIGPADWGMSRTFDALDLSLSRGRAKVDLLAGSAVQIDATRFDRHKPGEHFYGAYSSIKDALPGMTIEPYLLFKQSLLIKSESGVLGDALIASPGVRFVGKTPGRFDYTAEFLLQRGSYSADAVSAGAASIVLGWTASKAAWKPRFSAEFNYASGDSASKDGKRNTFDQFYPSNHGYYGMIDQFGWKNMKNYRTGFDFVAAKKIKVRADFNEFYLATVQDGLYNSSGSSIVLNRKATSSHVGAEINTVALYQCTKIWKLGAGLGHLYAGEFLKQSQYGFGYTYPYLMFVGSF